MLAKRSYHAIIFPDQCKQIIIKMTFNSKKVFISTVSIRQKMFLYISIKNVIPVVRNRRLCVILYVLSECEINEKQTTKLIFFSKLFVCQNCWVLNSPHDDQRETMYPVTYAFVVNALTYRDTVLFRAQQLRYRAMHPLQPKKTKALKTIFF